MDDVDADADLLGHLRALEVELHQPATRADEARLDRLLHADFVEYGRSGTVHARASMFSLLRGETAPAAIVADDFTLRRLGPTLALLNYRSAHAQADGTLERHTLRTSLWQRTDAGWQMSFHQGTATQSLA